MIRSRHLAGLFALGLLAWFVAPAIGQQDGPGYGPPGVSDPDMGPGPRGFGRGGMGPDDMGPGGPEGMGPYGMGPDGPGPDEDYGGGPRGYGPRARAMQGMAGDDMGPDGPGGGRGGAGLSEGSVKVGGQERPYYFHVPANVKKPAALVLVFHGAGGRPQGISRKSGWNEEADQNGFVVVYPVGSPAPSGRGGSWNTGVSGIGISGYDDKAYVSAILADVRSHVEIDPSRIYAAGHSMGGAFAYRLACEMSDTFAAIAAVSSTMVEKNCAPSNPVAVLHIHGSADDRIPLGGGRGEETARRIHNWPSPQAGVTTWARLDSCSAEPTRTSEGDVNCETYEHCRAAVEMCVRSGGEHPWPPGATERVWSFFAAHPKSAS